MARWVGSVFGSFLGLGSADALVVELRDVGAMYETIDSGHGGERVVEDLVPLREDQIATDHHAASLVTFGQEGEKHFHFFAALLDVSDAVEDYDAVAVQPLEQGRELERRFSRQEGQNYGAGYLLLFNLP